MPTFPVTVSASYGIKATIWPYDFNWLPIPFDGSFSPGLSLEPSSLVDVTAPMWTSDYHYLYWVYWEQISAGPAVYRARLARLDFTNIDADTTDTAWTGYEVDPTQNMTFLGTEFVNVDTNGVIWWARAQTGTGTYRILIVDPTTHLRTDFINYVSGVDDVSILYSFVEDCHTTTGATVSMGSIYQKAPPEPVLYPYKIRWFDADVSGGLVEQRITVVPTDRTGLFFASCGKYGIFMVTEQSPGNEIPTWTKLYRVRNSAVAAQAFEDVTPWTTDVEAFGAIANNVRLSGMVADASTGTLMLWGWNSDGDFHLLGIDVTGTPSIKWNNFTSFTTFGGVPIVPSGPFNGYFFVHDSVGDTDWRRISAATGEELGDPLDFSLAEPFWQVPREDPLGDSNDGPGATHSATKWVLFPRGELLALYKLDAYSIYPDYNNQAGATIYLWQFPISTFSMALNCVYRFFCPAPDAGSYLDRFISGVAHLIGEAGLLNPLDNVNRWMRRRRDWQGRTKN